MGLSSIEWTESTWNPVTGCTKISSGCDHCYAEQMARRLKAMGQANYANGFKLTLQPHMLKLPLQWKKPQRIFVNSMSDLFHRDVPVEFIQQVFAVMSEAHWHQFQVLTKRAQRLRVIGQELHWPSNVWMGVSVENGEQRFRVDHLRQTSAAIKFLSIEPLIGAIGRLDLSGIDWVIVGGESGSGARRMDPAWATEIVDQCKHASVPVFFKQAGTVLAREWGCSDRKGTDLERFPSQLRVRDYPFAELLSAHS